MNDTATYLVERYVERDAALEVEREASRARVAAVQLTAEGCPTEYVRALFVPEDETCFHIFAGPSREAVANACRRAHIQYERIVEVLDQDHTDKEDS